MGKITVLNKSNDGAVRTAKVKISNGHLLTRPLCNLYPFECGSVSNIDQSPGDRDAGNYEERSKRNSSRAAAILARKRIREQLNADSESD